MTDDPHTPQSDGWEATGREPVLAASVEALLADPLTWSEPSPEVEAAVLAAIGAQQRGAQLADVQRGAARSARRRPGMAGLWALAGAAAAAVVGVVVVNTGDDDPTDAADAVVAMSGTDLARGVTGEARLRSTTSGVEIVIRAPGLPRRDGGEFYEMWVKNCDGTELVPAGTFHDVDQATGWVGVPIDEYPVVTVTREVVAGPADAAQGSSGEIVLLGHASPCPAG